MSGRDKRAPATPEEEREQRRQLARELNEAAQNARDAARELRKARGEADASVEAMVDRHQAEINEVITENHASVQRYLETMEQQTREHYAGLLAADAKDLILRTCAIVLHLALPNMSTDEWIAHLQEEAADHTVKGCSCHGCLLVSGTTPAAPAQIMVGTREQLAAFIARGGDPGMVIDAG